MESITITYSHNTISYQENNVKMSNGLSAFQNAIHKQSGPECLCGYCLQCNLACI